MRNEDPEGVKLSSVLNVISNCICIYSYICLYLYFCLYPYLYFFNFSAPGIKVVHGFYGQFSRKGCRLLTHFPLVFNLVTRPISTFSSFPSSGPVYSEMFSPQRSPTPHRQMNINRVIHDNGNFRILFSEQLEFNNEIATQSYVFKQGKNLTVKFHADVFT